MEKNIEKQILEELKNINQTLQGINIQNNAKKTPALAFDIVRSLLIGFLIVGPAIAVVMVAFQIISN